MMAMFLEADENQFKIIEFVNTHRLLLTTAATDETLSKEQEESKRELKTVQDFIKDKSRENQIVYSKIIKFLDPVCDKLHSNVLFGDGAALWLAFLNKFESSSDTAKRDLLDNYLNIRSSSFTSVSDYIFKVESLKRNLTDLKTTLEDIHLMVLLNGLDSSYSQLLTVFGTMDNLKWDQAVKLINEYRGYERRNDRTADTTALQTNTKTFSQNKYCQVCSMKNHNTSECNRPCAFCGTKQHRSPDCPRRPKGMACFICGGNHASRNCDNRRKENKNHNVSSNLAITTHQNHDFDNFANLVTIINSPHCKTTSKTAYVVESAANND